MTMKLMRLDATKENLVLLNVSADDPNLSRITSLMEEGSVFVLRRVEYDIRERQRQFLLQRVDGKYVNAR